MRSKHWLSVLTTVTLFVASALSLGEEDAAQSILKATQTKGGLIVHVGCGDGKLTAELCIGKSFLVNGLAVDNPDEARKHVQSRKLYGQVSIQEWLDDKVLPYADNTVNLLIIDEVRELTQCNTSLTCNE